MRRTISLGRPAVQAAGVVILTSALLAPAAPVTAGGDPALKCASAKQKTAGKTLSCRAKAGAKGVKKTVTPDYSKCEEKFQSGFFKAEDKGGASCPTTGDAVEVLAAVVACTDQVFADLGGVPGAAGDEIKCRSSKVKSAGKQMDCLLKAESKATAKGGDPDFGKCHPKFIAAFGKAESKPPCTTESDAAAIAATIDVCAGGIANELAPWPANPADYTAGPASYIDTLVIPDIDSNPPNRPLCCKDFGAISKNEGIDNALAEMASSLSGLGVDLNAVVAEAIADESLVMLLDHQTLDTSSLPTTFTLAQLFGLFDNGTTPTEGAAGTGEFLIALDSFVSGSGEPLNHVSPADFDNSAMSTPTFDLELTLPFGFFTLQVTANQSDLVATPTTIDEVAGIEYTAGELSGYIELQEIFDFINAVLLSPQCACLGISDPVYTHNGSSWTSDCETGADTSCTLEEEGICVILADTDLFADPPQVCTVLPGLLNGATDIDTDNDNTEYEALSFGLQFTAKQAQINGVEP